jgi:prepilin-type processing-associated H-X9-DG protein
MLGQYAGISEAHDEGGTLLRTIPDITLCSKGGRHGNTERYFPSGTTPNYSYGINYYLARDNAGEFKRVKNPTTRMLMGTMGIDGWSGSNSDGGTDPFQRSHLAFRHTKMGNFCFFDGHVDAIKFLDVPEFGWGEDPESFWQEQ